MPVVEREETRARTELGAAQKDTARELGAKLSSLKGIVWVGVGLFVFGLASLVYPPLKAIIGSVTTSAALMLGGVALMVLPSLIVGNELLILGGVGWRWAAWFLAHRHGQLRGLVAQASAAIESQRQSPPQAVLRIRARRRRAGNASQAMTPSATRQCNHESAPLHEHQSQFPNPSRPLLSGEGAVDRRGRLGAPAGQEAPQPQDRPSPS